MLAESNLHQTAKSLINSPALFNKYLLGRHPYWDKQLEICRALRGGKKTILVPSGNATGKSWLSAGLILWYLASKPRGVIVTTAPTADQLANVLWRAVFGALERAPTEFLGESMRTTRQPLLIEKSKESYAIGLSTTKMEGSTGHHSEDLLVLVDEASGVDDDRISALNSLNPSQVILIGNPLVPSGIFYERCTRQELDPDDNTTLIRIRSDETPPAVAGVQRSPTGLADLDFLDRSERDYGRGSAWWLSHIEARFPDSVEGQLIDASWLDMNAPRPEPDGDMLVMGVDIASGRGGDRSVWIVRDSHGIIAYDASNTTSIEQWASIVANVARRYDIPPVRVTYDATGMGETFGTLLALNGYKGATPFLGGSGTNMRFENLRSATYWALRRRLNPTVTTQPFHIPPPMFMQMRKELLATTYELTSKDKTAIVSKDEIIKRIGHSPDFADCLSMTFAYVNY